MPVEKNTYIKYAQKTCGRNSTYMRLALGKKAHTHTYTKKKQQHNRKINQARELRH